MTRKPETKPAPASWGMAARTIPWEYAAAPESTDHVRIEPEYGLFIDNTFSSARPKATFEVLNPATEEVLSRVARASKADVNRAVTAARRAHDTVWARLPGSERAKYLYRIARIMQERSREFAVVETMNSGKPIKESRDVDVPLAAAHFFYYAGWADKLEYAFPNRRPTSLGVAAQIIPWNFPLLMLAWKIAPALACGNTVILKPASTTPLTAYLFADVVRQAECRRGGEHHHRAGRDRYGARSPSAGRQGRLHRIDGGRQAHRPRRGRDPQKGHPRAGRRGERRRRRRAAGPGRRRHHQRHLLQPGRGMLRRLAPVRPGIGLRAAPRQAEGPPLHSSAWATRSTRTPMSEPSTPPASGEIHELVESGIAEGAEIFQPDCELPAKGYFFRPTLFTGVSQSHRIAQEEIFGPVLSVLTFRTPEEAVEKANNRRTACPRGCGPRRGAGSSRWSGHEGRGGVGQHVQPLRPTSPFGGYKESGYGREGGRHGLAAYTRLDQAQA